MKNLVFIVTSLLLQVGYNFYLVWLTLSYSIHIRDCRHISFVMLCKISELPSFYSPKFRKSMVLLWFQRKHKLIKLPKIYLTLQTKFDNDPLLSCYLCVIIAGLFFNQQYLNIRNKKEKSEWSASIYWKIQVWYNNLDLLRHFEALLG